MSDTTPIQICHGNMSMGGVMGAVNISIVRPNSKAKSLVSKVYVSDAPMAKAPATTRGIRGCGEWISHVLHADGLHYAQVTTQQVRGGGSSKESRQILLRIHDAAPILVIHALIPLHPDSSIIKGRVPVFTGRAEVVSLEEAVDLGLPFREGQFIDEDSMDELFYDIQVLRDPKRSGRVQEVKQVTDKRGRKVEVREERTRRRVRIRK